jgi:hypothetical protein
MLNKIIIWNNGMDSLHRHTAKKWYGVWSLEDRVSKNRSYNFSKNSQLFKRFSL